MPSDPPSTNLPKNSIVAAEATTLRRRFYYDTLNPPIADLRQQLTALCRAWLQLTGCDWAWLWIKHQAPNAPESKWELTAVASLDLLPDAFQPPQLTPSNDNRSVAQCADFYQQPIYVDNINNWRHAGDSTTYEVVCKEWLSKKECHSFLSVPLSMPRMPHPISKDPVSDTAHLRAVVCVHFLSPPSQPLQSSDDYMLLGQVTARVLATAFADQQLTLLNELDLLATEFLTRRTRKPKESRQAYLNKVISLLRDHLAIDYISIFYRENDLNSVSCLATTGLRSQNGPIPSDEIGDAIYSSDECETGKVYSTGHAQYSPLGSNPPLHKFKYTELPENISEEAISWVLYPIKRAIRNAPKNDEEVLGVIRCVGSHSHLDHSILRNFDAIQVGILHFVCQRMAPVLETMAVHIQRERLIARVRHELEAPLTSIRNEVQQLLKDVETKTEPNPYTGNNIRLSADLALELAEALNLDAITVRPMKVLATMMEGDIVARVKATMTAYAREHNQMTLVFDNIKETFSQPLWCDRKLIEQALRNLITNAVKYGESGTTIRILGRSSNDGFLCIDVTNEGVGVNERDTIRIFDEEYRSPDTIDLAMGLGLGLPIGRTIMRKHSGDLLLTKRKDPTIFTMSFPAILTMVRPEGTKSFN